MSKYEGQGKHLLALLMLSIPIIVFARLPGMLIGEWSGIATRTWFWIAVGVPIVHQLGIMVLWRGGLHDQTMTRRFGDRAFTIFQLFFFPGLIARPISVIALALADRDSLQAQSRYLDLVAWLMIPVLLYLFYSIMRYFGIRRAAGADHFFEEYRTRPLIKNGIYRYLPNAMYSVGFFILWIPALLLASRAAIIVSAFQHAFIWAHFYFTEKPDMQLIYGEG